MIGRLLAGFHIHAEPWPRRRELIRSKTFQSSGFNLTLCGTVSEQELRFDKARQTQETDCEAQKISAVAPRPRTALGEGLATHSPRCPSSTTCRHRQGHVAAVLQQCCSSVAAWRFFLPPHTSPTNARLSSG